MTMEVKADLWCRFCKVTTLQWVDNPLTHRRACTLCWRWQSDGAAIEIVDGARMSDPPKRRDSHPPSAPPPPPVSEYALRIELNDALRRIDALEKHLNEQGSKLADMSHTHTKYK